MGQGLKIRPYAEAEFSAGVRAVTSCRLRTKSRRIMKKVHETNALDMEDVSHQEESSWSSVTVIYNAILSTTQ